MSETQNAFTRSVNLALKQWRDGDWLGLAHAPLNETGLLDAGFLTNEPQTTTSKATLLQMMLRWGIGRLRPTTGAPDWLDNRWRYYNLLYHYYELGWLAATVAERLAIAEQTFYEWRTQAVELLSHILQEEVEHSAFAEQRRRFVVLARYESLGNDGRRLLRLLAAAESPLPQKWLAQLLPNSDFRAAQMELDTVSLFQKDAHQHTVWLHAQAQEGIGSRLSAEERIGWLVQLARLYRESGDMLQAASCYLAADEPIRAARLLIDSWEKVSERQVAPIQPLLQTLLASGALDTNTRSELHLIAGRSAEHLDDLPSAIDAYGIALSAPDLRIKAHAYHLRAKVYQRIDLDQCLSHYAVCIELLLRQRLLSAELRQQLVRLFIDRAWIFIQERPDFVQAEADLKSAESYIAANDSSTWSDFYNAQAGLYFQQGEQASGLQMRRQAWVAAQESRDSDRMVKTALNLGTDYVWAGQYDRGLPLLERSLAIARETNNGHIEGLILKGIGNGLALQNRHSEAVTYYLEAYAHCKAMQNRNWLVSCCYDLTESYAELGEWEGARRYFTEGREQALALGHERYMGLFGRLPTAYPSLVASVNDRQQQAINYLHDHPALSRADYVRLTDVSKSQAHRDLEELIEQGVLERIGKGRATRYVLISS